MECCYNFFNKLAIGISFDIALAAVNNRSVEIILAFYDLGSDSWCESGKYRRAVRRNAYRKVKDKIAS